MSSRRWVILGIAVLLGLVAGALVLNYVRGIENDLDEEARRVKVYKVVEPVAKGTFAEDAVANGSIVEGEVAAVDRPATAITDPDQIAGQVAIADLPANTVVATGLFASQASQLSTFGELLAQNQVAVTISVDQVRGVAGLLVPGDFVNVLVTEGGTDMTPSEGDVAPDARYLYQKVQILAVGQQRQLQAGETVDTNPDGSPVVSSSGMLTLAVPADAAQWITSASPGSLYLTLVPKDYTPEPLAPISPSATLPGENPDQLTPYGPDGQTTP